MQSDVILDQCIERLGAGESIVDVMQGLQDQPQLQEELFAMLKISEELRMLPSPQCSAERAMKVMFQQLAQEICRDAPQKPLFLRMLFRATAILVVALLLGWSSITASANSVPGDISYPIKRFAEGARLFFTVSNTGQAELRIAFSERRLAEALVRYQRGEGIDDGLLDQMLKEGKLALDGAMALPAGQRSHLLSQLGYLAAHQKNVVEAVRKAASPAEQVQIARFGMMCGQRMQSMELLLKKAKMTPPSNSGCWWSGGRQDSSRQNSPADAPRCTCPTCK